jgi:hypothetical protein
VGGWGGVTEVTTETMTMRTGSSVPSRTGVGVTGVGGGGHDLGVREGDRWGERGGGFVERGES